jgi:probable HAF family extracellular repeat protein
MNPQSLHTVARMAALAALTVASACADPGPTESTDLSTHFGKGSTTSGPSVNSTSPNTSVRGVTLDVRILGSGFDAGSKAQWAIKGVPAPKVTTNSTRFVSSRELVANITIAADADPTLYDVIVTAAAGKPGIGTESFEVTVDQTDLGNLGIASAQALAVNDEGQITGVAAAGSTSVGHPFLWENGVMKDLGLPAGFTTARGEAINNLGQIAGYAMVQVNGVWSSRAFVWSSSSGYQLLPGRNGATSNQAMAINDNGVVAGTSGGHAVVWINGAVTDIHTFPSGASSAWDVNSQGEVVGTYWAPGSQGEAFKWTATTGMQLVRTMSGSIGEALGINDSGVIVGWGAVPGTTTNSAYVNRGGVPENLGISGGANSASMKVSIHGQIAGRAGSTKAALWHSDGSMIVLHPPRGVGTSEAYDVNANGWVVGKMIIPGRRSSETRAIRWRVF